MKFGTLCKPAQLYGVISAISIFMIFLQNVNDLGTHHYCLGSMECELQRPNWLMFVFKIGYVLMNIIILDSLCKNDFTSLSWLFVLAPYVSLFVILGLFMISSA